MLRQLVNSNLLTSNQHLARRLLRLKVSAADSRAPKFSDLSVEQRHQIDNYLDILLDWNTRMNLTGANLLLALKPFSDWSIIYIITKCRIIFEF